MYQVTILLPAIFYQRLKRMLLKLIIYTLIFLNPFVCSAAFSDALRQQKYPPSLTASKSNFINLACFMKTANGRVIDLNKLCDRVPKTLSKTKPATSNQYNYQAIENFNRKVYGD